MTGIQAVIFKKDFGLTKARAWLSKNKLVPIKPVHITKNYYRFRIKAPNTTKYRYRTVSANNSIKLIVEFKK